MPVSVPSRGNWGFLQKKNGKKKSLAIAVYVLLRGEWGFLLKIYVLTKEETFCFRPLARWMGVLTNIATMKNCSLDRFRPLSRWLGCLTDLNKWAREEMTELPFPLEVIGISNQNLENTFDEKHLCFRPLPRWLGVLTRKGNRSARGQIVSVPSRGEWGVLLVEQE